MRIAVMGYSGSGKSFLAKALGRRYHYPVLHMDRLHFKKNWQERSDEAAMFILKPWLEQQDWIVDGNYHHLGFDARAELADRIIILQLPRFTCLFRAYGRYRRNRGKTREDMASGCPEKFDLPFVWWILHQGRNKKCRQRYDLLRRRYPQKCITCRSQREIDTLLRME